MVRKVLSVALNESGSLLETAEFFWSKSDRNEQKEKHLLSYRRENNAVRANSKPHSLRKTPLVTRIDTDGEPLRMAGSRDAQR